MFQHVVLPLLIQLNINIDKEWVRATVKLTGLLGMGEIGESRYLSRRDTHTEVKAFFKSSQLEKLIS